MSFQAGTPERRCLIGLYNKPGRLWRAVKWSAAQVRVKRASECWSACLGPEDLWF